MNRRDFSIAAILALVVPADAQLMGGVSGPRRGSGGGAAPVLLTAQVTSTSPSPTNITMTFDSPLDATSVPAASAFLIVRNSIGRSPVLVAISGSTCDVTMDADYGDPSGGTISYTPGILKGANGVLVVAFSNVPVNP